MGFSSVKETHRKRWGTQNSYLFPGVFQQTPNGGAITLTKRKFPVLPALERNPVGKIGRQGSFFYQLEGNTQLMVRGAHFRKLTLRHRCNVKQKALFHSVWGAPPLALEKTAWNVSCLEYNQV